MPESREMTREELVARIAELERERDEARYHLREIARVGDTLSPQELINHAAAGCGIDRHEYSGECDPNRSMVELRSEVERLRAESAWVPCSERMPDSPGAYSTTVEAIHGDESMREVIGVEWNGKRWVIPFEAPGLAVRVIAWRPLPAPYTQEDSNA